MASFTSTHRTLLGPSAEVADISPASLPLPLGHILLAAAMIGLGIRGLIVGDFASVWQRIPIEHLPARSFFVYASAVIELATGLGLLMKRTVAPSSAVLLVFLVLWAVLLKLPAVLFVPQMEATWLGFGEIAVIVAGGWVVFASHAGAWSGHHLRFATGARGVRWARLLFVFALPMIGLSHFVYAKITVGFIPTWISAPYVWAYFTGGASIAASLAVLFGIVPKLASTLEAVMLSAITMLVWLPGAVTAPGNDSITPFLMSAAIACGAWALADSYRNVTSVRQPSKAMSE
ncbi:DoxX family protein [Rhodanobacter sp. L36]|uniref:DoxX family protein n=1 Tax=Rhodanobacter sp. L36 TaxID=1747221 RepID=UPI00131B80EB|nr:DoxX family protein [Rhodanobacter sp. L36]